MFTLVNRIAAIVDTFVDSRDLLGDCRMTAAERYNSLLQLVDSHKEAYLPFQLKASEGCPPYAALVVLRLDSATQRLSVTIQAPHVLTSPTHMARVARLLDQVSEMAKNLDGMTG